VRAFEAFDPLKGPPRGMPSHKKVVVEGEEEYRGSSSNDTEDDDGADRPDGFVIATGGNRARKMRGDQDPPLKAPACKPPAPKKRQTGPKQGKGKGKDKPQLGQRKKQKAPGKNKKNNKRKPESDEDYVP